MINEQSFQKKLTELMADLGELPADEQVKVQDLVDRVRTRHEKIRLTISELTESLDYLRLSVKYLVFDLEATRRENKHLRQLLDQMESDGQEGSADDTDFG